MMPGQGDVLNLPLLMSESSVYFIFAALFGIGAAGIIAYSFFLGARERTIVLIGVVPVAAMSLGYTTMGLELLTVETEGREQSVARFFAYTAVLLAVAYIFKLALALEWRRFLRLAIILLIVPWSALASWIAPGVLNSIMTLASVLTYVFAAYVLVGPLNERAATVSGEKRLFYEKLRNLFVLTYGCLILTSAISEQAAGLTDTFVGQVTAGMIDMVLMYGITFLVIYSVAVFEDVEVSLPTQATIGSAGASTDD